MKKILSVVFLFTINLLLAQSNFDRGFSDGYKKGYCQDQGNCIEPISPIAPIPSVYESSLSYQDGYNRGFQQGLNSQKSNNTTQNRTRYQTSESKFVDNKMYSRPSGGGGSGPDLLTLIILAPFYLISKSDEINISPVYSFAKPDNEIYKNGYGIELNGRYGQNKTDFIYGYNFIKYNNSDKTKELTLHSLNVGVAFNFYNQNKIQAEITPLIEYELNEDKNFGFGGYVGVKKIISDLIYISCKYKYTTTSNQLAIGITFSNR